LTSCNIFNSAGVNTNLRHFRAKAKLLSVIIIPFSSQETCRATSKYVFNIHGSVDHNKILIKMSNKLQLCRLIYYSIIPWLLYMFRAILSLIIRSVLTVITASGLIHMYWCRLLSWLLGADKPVPTQPRQQPTAIHVNETRSCNYS